MHRKTFKFCLLLLLFSLAVTTLSAQPGGPGGPPPGVQPRGERPDGRPGGWDRNMRDAQQRSQQVKQKKVRSGSTFKVVGTLIDSTKNEPLAYCNVVVLDKSDSSFVKGSSTNLYGYFEINDVPAGEYLLRVSYINYTTRYIPLTVENNTAMGNINMRQGAQAMKAVQVKASRPLYAQDGEKVIYNVADDPSIQTGTTNDALQNAPGVEVDVEGNITLRGVSSVEIWVNDKPSKLTEENLKTYLENLPANALDRIETITNPSAKYATDAEAVINIITSAHVKSNKFISFGLNGSTQPNLSPWLSYMWTKEKWSFNIFASGRYSFTDRSAQSWAVRRQDGTVDGTFDTIMSQTDTATSSSRAFGSNIFTFVNYEIDSSSEISFHGSVNGSWSRNISHDTLDRDYFFPGIDSSWHYITGDSTRRSNYFGMGGVDYTKKFDNEGHNLRLGINGRISRNNSKEWYEREYTTYTDLNENRYLLSDQHSRGGSFFARYNRPYSKQGELSYGLNVDHSYNDNDYRRFYFTSEDNVEETRDSLRSYHFSGHENNVSADVNWTHRWGGFTLSSGLGIGFKNFDWYYVTDIAALADDSTVNVVTYRPSIHLSYRTENMHNFKLNYSMRMNHPRESQLTSFRIYNEDSYSTGNSALKPSYTHNAEAGWTKYFTNFGNVGLEAYARLSTNEISNLVDAEEDDYLGRIVNYSTPYNMGSSWRYGTSLNMTYRPTGFFNVRLYANLYDYGYHMEYDRYDMMGNAVHQVVDTSKLSWSMRVNAWAKLWNQYQVHLSFNYNSKTIGLLSSQKERYSLNMGVRSDFFKRKMTVYVNIQDLFNWGKRIGTGSANTNPYYLTNSTNKVLNSRYISAGVTFRFGKMELERKAQTISDETLETTE
ncbi:MAG: TonB-dependent receptor family protein [Bacteroidales bacterium]|nr:TonB-dependent receptor family protein [Bacteroidales bacterium]